MAMLRTIEEIHSKEVGHPRFAKFIDMMKEENYEITNIKEYYERFEFYADGIRLSFDKRIRDLKWYLSFCKNIIKCTKIAMGK